MKFLEELKRRNVFRVGVAYAITAWLLLQLTEVLQSLLELPPGVGKIVIVVLLIGFPLTLFFAWAFELTPEGVKRDKDVDLNTSITSGTGKRLDRMIIIGLVAVILLMGVERLWFASTSDLQNDVTATPNIPPVTKGDDHQTSIAVLPFVNMSADAEQAIKRTLFAIEEAGGFNPA